MLWKSTQKKYKSFFPNNLIRVEDGTVVTRPTLRNNDELVYAESYLGGLREGFIKSFAAESSGDRLQKENYLYGLIKLRSVISKRFEGIKGETDDKASEDFSDEISHVRDEIERIYESGTV